MNDVMKIIDKHIGKHDECIEESMLYLKMLSLFDDGKSDARDEIKNDIMSHVSAVAALKMLKSELDGEVEY